VHDRAGNEHDDGRQQNGEPKCGKEMHRRPLSGEPEWGN
jgi:hypothetical protein